MYHGVKFAECKLYREGTYTAHVGVGPKTFLLRGDSATISAIPNISFRLRPILRMQSFLKMAS